MFGGGVAHRKKKCSNVAHPFTHTVFVHKSYFFAAFSEKSSLCVLLRQTNCIQQCAVLCESLLKCPFIIF